MKRHLTILTTLLTLSSLSWGQTITPKDSLVIMANVETVFNLFENPDYKDFEKKSTEKIYCIICFDRPILNDEPYMLDRKEFFDNHLTEIKKCDSFIRATKSKDVRLIKEINQSTDITVFFTIYKKDELAPGHEGGQFGIYFKKIKGEYKFAGMETMP